MKKRSLTFILIAAVLATSSACDSEKATDASPTPTPSPRTSLLHNALEDETDFKDTVEDRINARQSVATFLKTLHPDWIVQGMSLNCLLDDNRYHVAAHVKTRDGRDMVVPLGAWRIIKDNGESYWQAFGADK